MFIMTILSDEVEIRGGWLEQGGQIIADQNSQRIADLIAKKLVKVRAADGGWSTLYRDDTDSRLWELHYPHSDWHGGGPPSLRQISAEDASLKYGI